MPASISAGTWSNLVGGESIHLLDEHLESFVEAEIQAIVLGSHR
ncbi:MAG: hypothetical protein U5O39_17060 [Gammaproteobacteria bacterium]|nr:hypothetical protein [Gammaproteobacteria bacterium]